MSHTITIRPRQPSDLPACASLLSRVYEKDRYPVQGVSHAIEFLSSPSTLAAWVAIEENTTGKNSTETQDWRKEEEEEEEEENSNQTHQILAHIALTTPSPTTTDPAVILWRSRNASEPVAVLERLFVDPAARGQGLAERLMRVVSEAAEKRGLRCVLFALVKDVGAMRLYERVGWREFGRRGYGYRDGEGVKREMEAVCFVGSGSESESGRREGSV